MTLRFSRKKKQHLVSFEVKEKDMSSMGSKFEPAIWSYDTAQQIACFDSCQLTTTQMSNMKEGRFEDCVFQLSPF